MKVSTDVEYEVYAIRCAREDGRTYGENFVSPPTRELSDTRMPLDYFVWVIRGGGRTIIVDPGFDETEARRRGREREMLFPIRQSLGVLGVSPDMVADVCLTHLHWDHAGNHDLFRTRATMSRTGKSATAPAAACATPR